jgi:hypothetical protein
MKFLLVDLVNPEKTRYFELDNLPPELGDMEQSGNFRVMYIDSYSCSHLVDYNCSLSELERMAALD